MNHSDHSTEQADERDVVVRVRGLKKSFRIGFRRKRVDAVKDATFDVRRGEIFGLVGPNGAGKTSTIKMLLGLITPDAGHATIFGTDIRSFEARTRVGFLPETPHFYEYLRPAELLDYFGRLYGLDSAARRKRIPELLEQVGLSRAVNKPLRKFSKGMLQRIGLAQALLPESDLIILDEPQSGLDPIGRKDVREVIEEQRNLGRTVLFCSHILSDVEMICDRVAIMVGGQVRQVGALDEIVDRRTREVEVVLSGAPPQDDERAFEVLPGARVRYRAPNREAAASVIRWGLDNGRVIQNVVEHQENLEDVFIRTTLETSDDRRT